MTLEVSEEWGPLLEAVLTLIEEVVFEVFAGNTILKGGTFGALASMGPTTDVPFEALSLGLDSLSHSGVSMPSLSDEELNDFLIFFSLLSLDLFG